MNNPDQFHIVYCNLNRSRVAHDLFDDIGDNYGADMMCCSEPNQNKTKVNTHWASDKRSDVAQWTTGGEGGNSGSGTGFAWTKTCGIVIYTCYFSPNATIEAFQVFLDELGRSIRSQMCEIIVQGDFNAWGTLWGSRKTDKRGDLILDWMEQWKMVLVNDGLVPTFVKGAMESFIDLTFCSFGLVDKVVQWRVMEEAECGSDHQPISLKVAVGKKMMKPQDVPRIRRFREELREPLMTHIGERLEDGLSTEQFMDVVIGSSRAVLGVTSGTPSRAPKFWWTSEIAELRRDCIRTRRKLTRTNKRTTATQEDKVEMGTRFAETQKTLREAIKSSKRACWERHLAELNVDPWGTAFRIATGKTRRRQKVDADIQRKVADELFPRHEVVQFPDLPDYEAPTPFSPEELWRAIGKIKPGKAPGPDGVSPEVTRAVCLHFPDRCLKMFNDCLTRGEFPKSWRRAVLMVIPKPKKERSSPQTYRPICLINTMGKVMEHMVQHRLRAELGVTLSEQQFGFRPGRSTVDALRKVFEFGRVAKAEKKYAVLIALDVKNAFNSAPWPKIDEALESMKAPSYLRKLTRSYLSERTLIVGDEELPVTCGVPQGSVLGPLLWCILYNAVLEMELDDDTQLSCYADDLAVMVSGKTIQKMVGRATRMTGAVVDKLQQLGLSVATDKTEAIMLASKRKTRTVAIPVKDQNISTTESAKYLGVWLSRDMNMGCHMKETAQKADTAAMALSRVMPNQGGPGQNVRLMLARGVLSILLYAAPAWYDGISSQEQLGDLQRAARRAVLRVCSGYRSISYPAAEVIAGIPPARMLARESFERARGIDRRIIREETRRDWGATWEQGGKGEWTRRLIPNLDIWLDRQHGEVDSFLCQLLSGHGVFRAYLWKRGLSLTEECVFCFQRDTAEHALFQCKRFGWKRRILEETIRLPLETGTIVAAMCYSEDTWRAVAQYTKEVILAKDSEARRGRS